MPPRSTKHSESQSTMIHPWLGYRWLPRNRTGERSDLSCRPCNTKFLPGTYVNCICVETGLITRVSTTFADSSSGLLTRLCANFSFHYSLDILNFLTLIKHNLIKHNLTLIKHHLNWNLIFFFKTNQRGPSHGLLL